MFEKEKIRKIINDFMNSGIQSEAEVRSKLIVPLIEWLGYPAELRAEEFPVYGNAGSEQLRAKPADFVLFNDVHFCDKRTRQDLDWVADHSLLIVETKKPGEMPDTNEQVQFYAVWTRAVAYLLTDGNRIKGYTVHSGKADDLVIDCDISELEEDNRILQFSYEKILSLKPKTDSAASFEKKADAEKIDKLNPFRFNSNSTAVVGREKEIAALNRFIAYNENSNVKWWAITGVGGCGKSRLAYEFACGLDRVLWHSEFITKDRPFTFEQLQLISDREIRNLLLIIDNDALDMEPLAKWISYIYDKREERQIRVLICQRVRINAGEDERASWLTSLLDASQAVKSLLYQDSIFENAIDISTLREDQLKTIAGSFSRRVFDKDLDEAQKELVIDRLKTIDRTYCRPLYVLLLTEALVKGDIKKIYNEDELLDYAFQNERSILHAKIKNAFGFSLKQNRRLYEEIETDYAEAVVCNYNKMNSMKISDLSKECNISEERYRSLCEEYGLTVNGCIPMIEPDLLAEYYVLRYADQFHSILGVQSFWVPFFRDFNKLLTTKYTLALKAVLSIGLIITMEFYIRGLYEAFFLTDDNDEQRRLIQLMESVFETVYESLGPEYDENPYAAMTGGRAGAIGMVAPLLSSKMNMYLERMQSKLVGQSNIRYISRTNLYIDLYNSWASKIYENLVQRMKVNENDCAGFIDDLNQLEKLHYEIKKQKSEVPWYLSHAWHLAMCYFFSRPIKFSNEISSQIAQKGMFRLKAIMEKDGDISEKENYIKALMVLYVYDDDEYYKKKPEIWEEICSYFHSQLENDDENENMKKLFYSFFSQYPHPNK